RSIRGTTCWRQAAGLVAEHEHVAPPVGHLRVAPRGRRLEEPGRLAADGGERRQPTWLIETPAPRSYTEVAYRRGDVLVFGNEARGLPQSLLEAHADRLLAIPARPQVRSLNLSNCAAIVAYEAIRQWGGSVGG
ncbi:MAG: tRNA (cytidine(34)-2'-O)-methyltransferase, partial [Planctomycetia bacterium]